MVPNPMRRRSPCALPSLLFTLLLAAQAQAQSPATTRPDPLDPKAQVPSVRYESSFAQFRRIGDDKPVAWREANDAVARIGGWRVYAREAQQPEPSVAAVLGGCASFTPDGGFGAVERTTKERIGKDLQWARGDADLDSIAKRVAELLAKPLTVDDAVQVALLNNRGCRPVSRSSASPRPRSCRPDACRTRASASAASSAATSVEIERGLHFNLARLVAMPLIGGWRHAASSRCRPAWR
jgi:hypothetical protein